MLLLPPQPTVPISSSKVNKATAVTAVRLRLLVRPSTRTSPKKPMVTLASSGNPCLLCAPAARSEAELITNCTCTGPSAGVTDDGVKRQDTPAGSAPQVKLIGLLNPLVGVTVMLKVALWPASRTALIGLALKL